MNNQDWREVASQCAALREAEAQLRVEWNRADEACARDRQRLKMAGEEFVCDLASKDDLERAKNRFHQSKQKAESARAAWLKAQEQAAEGPRLVRAEVEAEYREHLRELVTAVRVAENAAKDLHAFLNEAEAVGYRAPIYAPPWLRGRGPDGWCELIERDVPGVLDPGEIAAIRERRRLALSAEEEARRAEADLNRRIEEQRRRRHFAIDYQLATFVERAG